MKAVTINSSFTLQMQPRWLSVSPVLKPDTDIVFTHKAIDCYDF